MFIIRISLLVCILFSLSFICLGQSPTSTPNTQIEQQQRIQEMKREQKDYEWQILGNSQRSNRRVFRQSGKILGYPNKKELAVVEPDEKYFEEYKAILKEKNTGLTRLISSNRCGNDSRVVEVSPECIRFEKIPGYASSFSFRVNRYATGTYSDVLFKENVLYSSGDATTGIFTKLGEMEIDSVSDQTKGAKYIYEFVPETKDTLIKQQNSQFVEGIEVDGFNYAKYAKLSVGNTYLLRSIAYKFKTKRYENGRRIRINNTVEDKRRDIIVAFYVIEIDVDGSVTLLWKILQNKDAPKLTTNSK